MNCEFHPEAEQELYEAAERYENEVRGLGKRFRDEIFRVVQLLVDRPEVGSPVDRQLRYFVLRRFPFSVVYAATSQSIHIIAVAHGSRAPGYWQLRVHDR